VLASVWLAVAAPLLGFLVLSLFGKRLPRRLVSAAGVGSVGVAFLSSLLVFWSYLQIAPAPGGVELSLGNWFDTGGLSPRFAVTIDPLSLVMLLVVTGVGFLIHLYSAEFMREDPGLSRFFAYLNLFVGSMLVLVLARNLLLLYLGWEGVGLCSYLLIGFWYRDPQNGAAARKAFIVTRIGDTALAVGLLLLFTELGTLDLPELLARASLRWPLGSGYAVAAAALLLFGAAGKSAQLPLQTWLPDAMAGPTPVSALIHAATMVTAGVYLILRTHALFLLAPPVLLAVAVIGAATLLLAGCSALVQRDLKRVLAYSTISQLGYLFLALGVGAWSAAVFHLVTHAFFKALLFLAAGAVILAQQHEHDIFKMGGLRRRLPVVFWTFLAGASALAGLPLLTAGFYSKDLILFSAWSSGHGGAWLFAAGLAGALLTALYSFRLVFVVFFGESKTEVTHEPGRCITVPLVILAILSLVGGFIELPQNFMGGGVLSRFLDPVLAQGDPHGGPWSEAFAQIVAGLVSLLGLFLAWRFLLRAPRVAAGEIRWPLIGERLRRFWFDGFGFDRLYDALLIRPFVSLSARNAADVVDRPFLGLAWLARGGHRLLARTQTGKVRWYAAAVAVGAIVVVAVELFR